MRIKHLLVITVATIAAASVVSAQSYSASYSGPGPVPIFTDNFSNGSTINNNTGQPGGTPTASSTSYDINSAKGANLTGTIVPGDLTVGMQGSSSAFVEDDALFTTRANAVTLTSVGQYIDFMFEFTDTGNVVGNGNDSSLNQLNIGLYDSGGTAPNPANLATISTATGGTQGWTGYYSDILQAQGTGSKLYYRPLQNTGTGDMTLTVSSGINGAIQRPAAIGLVNGSQTSSVLMTNGAQYTEDFRITLSAANTLTVSNELFSGIGTTGTVDFAFGGYTNATDFTFDGMAFGLGCKDSLFMTQDVSFIQLTDNIVPEPSTWLLLVSGFSVVIALVSRRRR